MNHMKNQFTRMNLDFPKLHIRKKTQPLCTTCCVLSHFWLHNMKHYLICTNINMHKFDVFRTEIRTSKKKMLWDCEVCFTRKHYCILSSSFFFISMCYLSFLYLWKLLFLSEHCFYSIFSANCILFYLFFHCACCLGIKCNINHANLKIDNS